MHSSRLSAVQLAIHISKRLETRSVTWLYAVNEWSFNIQRMCFDQLDSFNIQYTDEQKLFNNLAVFDFESICLSEEKIKNTETITWVGKHVPISVSISSNLIASPIFLCNSNPRSWLNRSSTLLKV